MRAPRWARWLLERLAPVGRAEEVVGDLEEAHRARVHRRGRLFASVLTGLEVVDMAWALLRDRRGRFGRRATSMRTEIRAGRSGIPGLSWLDVKLGTRMLARYPGVTIIGGLALAIGIGVGAAYLEVVNDLLRPALPLAEGDRIVGIQNWDVEENDPDLRSLRDFMVWRASLETVRELSAFRTIERNLGAGDTPGRPARGAAITPSAFGLTRVPALRGRPLIDADALEGAPPAVVLGYDVWRSRFSADPGIIGDAIRLGDSLSTVVGVMPEGFRFPVSHEFWVPLRPGALAYGPRQGPAVQVFGRLAPGATFGEARAELSAVGAAAAAELPATHGRLRPRVVPYTQLFMGGEGSGPAYLVQPLFVLLLLVLASNVATMVFARTATRENEVAMRFALGASRGRILAQFFIEALVLALAAAAVGLALVAWGTGWLTPFVWELTQGEVPFWLDSRLNATTVLYALALAVIGALVAGVLPALRATRSRLQAQLRQAPGAGDSSLRLGGLWSAMIIVQVAFAVLVLPPSIVAIEGLADPGYVDPGFPAEEYLSARLELEPARPDAAGGADAVAVFEATLRELEERLRARPEVSRVTFATRLPGMDHPQPWVEVDSAEGAPVAASQFVMPTSVDEGFFEAFGAEIVAGRGFNSGDVRSEPGVVVVNEAFVTELLQGRNAIGRRLRYSTRVGERAATGRRRDLARDRRLEPSPWYEIVGVVRGLGMDTNRNAFWPGWGPGVYHPLTTDAMGAGGEYGVRVALHVRADAAAFAPRLREVAGAVDPALRLYDVLPLDRPVDRSNRGERTMSRVFSWLTALVAALALLVSIAGTYSVMAFTVARRTREIGIRIALGADRRHILTDVFSRATIQIGLGILAGSLVWFYIIVFGLGGGDRVGLLLASVAGVLLVGVAACAVPVRRALGIEPTEALRDVG